MGAWKEHYQRAVYIDMGIGDGSVVEQRAKDDAQTRGWNFERMAGDSNMVKRLLYGEWENDFLVLRPGEKLKMTYDERVIGAEKD